MDCVGEEAAKPDVCIVWARVKGYPWWPVRAPWRVLCRLRLNAFSMKLDGGKRREEGLLRRHSPPLLHPPCVKGRSHPLMPCLLPSVASK